MQKTNLWIFAVPNPQGCVFDLCQCLRGGAPPPHIDWMAVINLANNTLTTPALNHLALKFPETVPADVRFYLNEIVERNLLRNDRLSKQMFEAITALNADGIKPFLLKGAAMLARAHPRNLASRIMADLDLLVSPEEIETALSCLSRLGYDVQSGSPEDRSIHFVALGRSRDVGQIDLHRCPPGPDFLYREAGEIMNHSRLLVCGEASAYIPVPTYQALILLCHDLFHDGDYRAGRIDLRHLLDLRELANSSEGVDWTFLGSLPRNKFVKNAIETQLVTLFMLLDVNLPIEMRNRFVPRLQYWRRSLQLRFPALRGVLSMSALFVDLPSYMKHRGQQKHQTEKVGHSSIGSLDVPTWSGLVWMLNRLYDDKERRIGKV
jgi:hypothetical protein